MRFCQIPVNSQFKYSDEYLNEKTSLPEYLKGKIFTRVEPFIPEKYKAEKEFCDTNNIKFWDCRWHNAISGNESYFFVDEDLKQLDENQFIICN